MRTTVFYQSEVDNAVRSYLHKIGSIPILSTEEEVELAQRIRRGDEDALSKLVEGNLRFVVVIAKKYAHLGLPLTDLISEGNMGLIRAARKFDPERGVKFTSYAVWWIKQYMLQAVTEQSKVMRLPANRARELCKVERIYNDLLQKYGRSPTAGEIAERSDLARDVVEDILRASRCISLEKPVGSDACTELINFVAEREVDREAAYREEVIRGDVEEAMKVLDGRENEVISMRYGLGDGRPRTLTEIGRLMGLSKERVRQIETRAIEKMRRNIDLSRLKCYLNS
ncbi:MAG: sigma-70 family RNA polymerase sigma factor [bacterium]